MQIDGDAFVEGFLLVFNSLDPVGIAAMMTDDVILEASFGKEPWGERVIGREAVRAFYVDMFARIPDARWDELRRIVCPPYIVVESLASGTPRQSTRFETTICDVLTLRDGLIAAKRSYRKVAAI